MGNSKVFAAVVVVIAALLAVAGWFAWRQQQPRTFQAPPVAEAPRPTEAASAPGPAASAIAHPVAEAPAASAAGATGEVPAMDSSDGTLKAALDGLIGSKAVMTWLNTDGFIRRVVATVDNLGRPHASPRLWPVRPIDGRFSTAPAGDGGATIAATNKQRYAGFVKLVESVDATRAAALYLRMYPLFQQAYEELGYPNGYFNDRLVAVIDVLLTAPTPPDPIAVRLTEVKGPVASERPWVRYEFADPALEQMPAGAKIMARLGEDQARRVKAKLLQFRRGIAKGG